MPRFSLAVLKLERRQALISGKAGLSPEERQWGLSERFQNMSMPLSFSVLEFNFWSVITPVHPCNFIAFFITDIIYNNPAVILASAMVSAVSVSPSKMMKVRLDHIRHTRFSFFLCFLSPKCWLSHWNSSGFFFLSIHPQRYTASCWPYLRPEGFKKTSLIELLTWCSRDHGRHCVLLIFPVLLGVLICVPYQSLEFLHGRWTFGALNSNSGGPRGKKNPWHASRIAGHVLASRSHTETLLNLQRRAVQYWR